MSLTDGKLHLAACSVCELIPKNTPNDCGFPLKSARYFTNAYLERRISMLIAGNSSTTLIFPVSLINSAVKKLLHGKLMQSNFCPIH